MAFIDNTRTSTIFIIIPHDIYEDICKIFNEKNLMGSTDSILKTKIVFLTSFLPDLRSCSNLSHRRQYLIAHRQQFIRLPPIVHNIIRAIYKTFQVCASA